MFVIGRRLVGLGAGVRCLVGDARGGMEVDGGWSCQLAISDEIINRQLI